jgi:hypothetical protein
VLLYKERTRGDAMAVIDSFMTLVDTISGHTPKHLLERGPQMSLAFFMTLVDVTSGHTPKHLIVRGPQISLADL